LSIDDPLPPRPAHREHPDRDAATTAADIPELAKAVAASSLRIGGWAAATGLRATRRVVEAARHPEPRRRTVEPQPAQPVNPLHQAGQELLRRSRDVWSDDRTHPAYARIIEELAPDEGRILMLLLRKGPQAAVDVRTGGLVGTVSSNLVQANLNMIGALSGCRYLEKVPSYLHNLERLGLIWFSRETVSDPMEYQVLEAQPDVLEAMHSVRRARVVRRSIHLTPFGEDFCRDGLGLHLTTGELEGIPRHRAPHEK
jgi:Abortive infection alpha